MSRVAKRKDPNGRVLPDGVSYRSVDQRYLYRYQLYGKAHYIYDRDLNELKKKILQRKIDVANGVNTNLSKLTLGEWYPQYLEIYKRNKVRESTYFNLEHYYKWYIKDSVIDRMPLKDLKRSHVVAHFKKLAEKKHLAHGTLRSLASMLYNCLQQGVYDGVLSMNAAMDIMKEVTAVPKELREALSVEEVRVMVDFLKHEGEWQNVYLPCVAIGLSTGFRCGELFGLTWKDIDFKNKLIHVNHTINYRNRGNGHAFFISAPKTKNAVRDFPMTQEVEALFKKQRKYQKSIRIRDDITIDGYNEFVFTAKTGWPYTHEAITRTVRLIVKRANEWEAKRAEEEHRKPVVIRDHTPHYWRHTFTTRLVENEVPYENMRLLLGHSSIKTTIDIYSHISETLMKKAKGNLEGIISVM